MSAGDVRFITTVEIEIGKVARQECRVDQACEAVFRRGAGHGDGAFDELVSGLVRGVGGGNRCLAATDEDAQADGERFGTVQVLELSHAPVDGERLVPERYRVSSAGTGSERPLDQAPGEIGNLDRHRRPGFGPLRRLATAVTASRLA